MSRYILTLSCKDDYGIVSAVAGFLSSNTGFILESAQASDTETDRFFMRVMFRWDQRTPDLELLRSLFKGIAEQYKMEWDLSPELRKPRVMLMVSKQGHCLNTLLHHWHCGSLPVEIACVASNHTDLQEMTGWYKVPFFHLPLSKETKAEQEKQVYDLVQAQDIDLVVLARYMQILSPWLVSRLKGRAINIHHSFLPSFKGAKPYHQAYNRGVKLIGATAHYVSDDLDEGPIIEQEVQRVEHSNEAKDLVAIGRDTESLVLLRAVKLHASRRVFLNGNKTVVFR